MHFLLVLEFQDRPEFFSDHSPILSEAGSISWGPTPFRFCNTWLLNKECCNVIINLISSDFSSGWAGFMTSSQPRKIKEAVKVWFADFELQRKKQESSLPMELPFFDGKAENNSLSSPEMDLRLAITGDLMNLYFL